MSPPLIVLKKNGKLVILAIEYLTSSPKNGKPYHDNAINFYNISSLHNAFIHSISTIKGELGKLCRH